MLGPATAVANELMGIPSFETPDYSELFSEEKAMIGRLKKVFLMVAGSAVQKFGPQLEEHQAFIGPKAESIRIMGDKVAAIKAMKVAGVPCVPGSDGPLNDDEKANKAHAKRIVILLSLKLLVVVVVVVCVLYATKKN